MNVVAFTRSLRILAGAGLLGVLPEAAGSEAITAQTEVLELSIGAEGLGGPGGERLRAELRDVQFVALGEDHGLAEPPQLAAALASELGRLPGSPVYHAVEVGPFGTRWATAHMQSGGLPALQRAMAGQPFAMPFLSNVEDARLAFDFARKGRLWGIDQEFIGGAAQQFEDLAGRCGNADTTRQLRSWASDDRKALKAGRFDKVAMSVLTPEQIEQAGQTCKSARDRTQFSALAQSARIYRYNNEGRSAQNNEERAQLMTGYFLSSYRAARDKAPRVVFKMGAYHLGRGTTPTSIYDLGSMLPGLAASNGNRSLHIAIMPLGGSVRQIAPDDKSFTKVMPYADQDVAPLLQAVGIAPDRIPAKGLVVIPLRPLRYAIGGQAMRKLPEVARFVLLGYDYLVTTRDAHAATNFEVWDGN